MRYGIFSDIHSNLEALSAVLGGYKSESVDKFLCIGDIVGYAVDYKECIEIIKEVSEVTVAGNHDWAAAGLFSLSYFNSYAREAILWTKERLDEQSRYFLGSLKLVYKNEDLTLVHGTLNSPEEFNYMLDSYSAYETFKVLDTDVCFVGHTHVCGIFIEANDGRLSYRQESTVKIDKGRRYIINVGSVGQPRDRNPKSAYCIFDTEKKEIQIKRISYDTEATREKIFQADLPHHLGDRLISGS